MSNPPTRRSQNDRPRYTIVIPAYNEAQRISPTLDHILAHACEKHWTIEIIVVDDGSDDATAEVVSRYAARNPAVRLIKNLTHRGKGYCVRAGAMAAAEGILLFTDADLPASMNEAELLLQALAEGADIAIGSRWLRPDLQQVRQSWQRRNCGRCFNLLVRLLLGLGFADTQCGFKAFTGRAASLTFRFQSVWGWAFDAELLVIAKSLGLAVQEVPLRICHDARSRLKPLFHGFQMLSEVLQIALRRLCGKYPISAAPAMQSHIGMTGKRDFWLDLMRTPARIGFAMLTLLATVLMHDISPVAGSPTATSDTSAAWQAMPANHNVRNDFKGFAQDGEQNPLAEDSGDAFED